jgi:hypothetical protein
MRARRAQWQADNTTRIARAGDAYGQQRTVFADGKVSGCSAVAQSPEGHFAKCKRLVKQRAAEIFRKVFFAQHPVACGGFVCTQIVDRRAQNPMLRLRDRLRDSLNMRAALNFLAHQA